MNERLVSDRIQCIASFLPRGALFADIGSDHAYLPVYVCHMDEQAKAIAGEINEGPYQSAKSTVAEEGLTDRIEVRKGDGLAVISANEVNQVVIAGMGGSLISTILEKGKEKLAGVGQIIAQPNVEARAVRVWLQENGYRLNGEAIIEEAGHIYEVISAISSNIAYSMTETELLLGPYLMKEKSDPFQRKWKMELEKRERVIKQMKKAKYPDVKKMEIFRHEIKLIKEVLT
ncbi:tRNA (adenine(22)-N(1))-methyltransferase TrmK [Sediminibacillus dalangtanensis]|uniref:tRNA (Adenine(22)-N(1))-methyltransferase TrmK n=1 Tax=Sediminibacillus dalangtanensis TaxID=2729421 RepID=A0ABX7VYU4_9BACI|nr:class I SAM-dependent methyltransferase [Sediminibacillus dalangtanensis]QTM99851.1 tRNA (adenine(22)-N(1))-methyltransferase TrmK [Sediminibacillus dalangtanensis]